MCLLWLGMCIVEVSICCRVVGFGLGLFSCCEGIEWWVFRVSRVVGLGMEFELVIMGV